jgi:hypothetical protein
MLLPFYPKVKSLPPQWLFKLNTASSAAETWNCLGHTLTVCLFVSMGFRGKPRMYLSLAGFLYRPLWMFQLWPLDARAPTDASRTPAAEGGTCGRGVGPVIWPKCRLPRYILGIFYVPQICDMGPTALLPF